MHRDKKPGQFCGRVHNGRRVYGAGTRKKQHRCSSMQHGSAQQARSTAARSTADDRLRVATTLITGGAGFIGSHLADVLLARGHRVRVLDNLTQQVHGGAPGRPSYLAADVELRVGDVRDRDEVERALEGVDAVVHLAARVGVGQSMYELAEYVDANSHGTAVLLEVLSQKPVRKLVVASSMSIYGEGAYVDAEGRPVEHVCRRRADLERDEWEPCDGLGRRLIPIRTPESKRPTLSSVYALSKYDQEQLSLIFGEAYGVPVVALRFFNVYGPRQALGNPYTGVLSIFASRLLNGLPPMVYEDGLQRRDFVSVHDVAEACALALERDGADGRAVNIGAGRPDGLSVLEIGWLLAHVLEREIEPEITGTYRAGDIRHCFGDVRLARELLDYEPRVALADGMGELAQWLSQQDIAPDRLERAAQELTRRGLTL